MRSDMFRDLKKHDVKLKKRYGQNFISDENLLESIADCAHIDKNDVVIEIGPGAGSLTKQLARRASRVITIEIDDTLIPLLHENLDRYENIEIINADFMDIQISDLISEYRKDDTTAIKVVANLPYYITTPIIMKLLESKEDIACIVVMVQKEVAERFCASSGGKDYGAVTLAINYYSKPYIAFTVPAYKFTPRPKVDSALIVLEKRAEPIVTPSDEAHMFRLIKAAFGQRRKTLYNALSGAPYIESSRENIRRALATMGLREDTRGERLELADYARLSDILLEYED